MKLPLHIKVLIGFILGIFLGFFLKNDKILEIKLKDKTENIKSWQTISLCSKECVSFSYKEAKKDFYKIQKLHKENNFEKLRVKTADSWKEFNLKDLTFLKLKYNIYDLFEVIGKLFIRALQMIAIPLVIASLISGVGGIGDMKKFRKMALFSVSFYLFSTVAAILLGLVLVNYFKPGLSQNADLTEIFAPAAVGAAFDLKSFLIEIIPTNPFKAMAENNMLQIIFFSIASGMVLNLLVEEKRKFFLGLTDTVSDIMIRIVNAVMKAAPLAVFCLIASVVSDAGTETIKKMLFYMILVISGLFIYLFGFYSIYLKVLSKTGVLEFFRGVKEALFVAFSTSSSAAALPVNFECCEKNLKVPKSVTGFVLPLGATVNMNGTAMYQAIAAVFIAQIYGINLSFSQQAVIVLMAVCAAVGSSPIPGVGIIMLVMILNSVNIPVEGVALILGVDRILDMFRTVVNVAGDSAACVIIRDRLEV